MKYNTNTNYRYCLSQSIKSGLASKKWTPIEAAMMSFDLPLDDWSPQNSPGTRIEAQGDRLGLAYVCTTSSQKSPARHPLNDSFLSLFFRNKK